MEVQDGGAVPRQSSTLCCALSAYCPEQTCQRVVMARKKCRVSAANRDGRVSRQCRHVVLR